MYHQIVTGRESEEKVDCQGMQKRTNSTKAQTEFTKKCLEVRYAERGRTFFAFGNAKS